MAAIKHKETPAAPSLFAFSRNVLPVRPVVLALALLLLTRNLTARFVATHEWNSAGMCMFARNHVEYGLGYTKLFCTHGDTAAPPAQPQRYLNHPPLLAIWAAIPLFIFGDHEWAGRLVPIAATLGSAWILMVMVGRLHSPLLGLLTGLLYVVFPVTAYFGRMICHEAPVQFFSLLMLHGYAQWAGLYGAEHRPSAGKVYYVLGAVLGIGTGWAAVVMAGLIWCWSGFAGWRAARARSATKPTQEWQRLAWTTIVPGFALTAVMLHILWGTGWNFSLFGPLLWSRTIGPQDDAQPITWANWLSRIVQIARLNFTVFGIAAAVVYPAVLAAILRRTSPDSPFRQMVRNWTTATPILLSALHGLIWMLIFKHQSYIHQYWQFFLAPFLAVATASVLLACHTLLSNHAPRLAPYVTGLLLLAPMPLFALSLDQYHQSLQASPGRVEAFVQLAKMVPPRVPVMTSTEYRQFSETFGTVVSRFFHPIYAYYAHRPLVYSIDLNEIQANQQAYPAYLLEWSSDPKVQRLAQQLADQYQSFSIGQHHLIFDLRRPKPAKP